MRSPRSPLRRLASVQEQLPLEEIAGDVARLRGGEQRAVLETGSVPFELRSEGEQEAILAGYRRFLNGLDYPLQVLVRVVPADVEGYLAGLAGARRGDEALRRLALDHAAFVRRIARERTLLDRRFYVVVPAGGDAVPEPGGFRPGILPWRRGPGVERGPGEAARARRTLSLRCGEVVRGLGSFGVGARRLGGEELASLWREVLAGAAGGSPPALLVAPLAATPVVVRESSRSEADRA